MTDGQKAYRRFLASKFWKELAGRKKAKVGKCETCGVRWGLEVHHWRYPGNWYETDEGDLEVLCGGCHGARHGEDDRWWMVLGDADIDIACERVGMIRSRMMREEQPRLLRSERKFLRRAMDRWGDNRVVQFKIALVLWDVASPLERETRKQITGTCDRIGDYYVRKGI